MKKILITIVGILDLLACASLAVFYYAWILEGGTTLENAHTWGLPVLIGAILNLIAGIYSIKNSKWNWAIFGFTIACLVWTYCLILLWLAQWTMS